jgi:hypothetical protein
MKQTKTEFLAQKLFGWELVETNEYYRRENAGDRHSYKLMPDDMLLIGKGKFPDFTDWNWIRRMEDRMETDALYAKYRDALLAVSAKDQAMWTYADWYKILRATPAQRIAAAVRVLEEAGL